MSKTELGWTWLTLKVTVLHSLPIPSPPERWRRCSLTCGVFVHYTAPSYNGEEGERERGDNSDMACQITVGKIEREGNHRIDAVAHSLGWPHWLCGLDDMTTPTGCAAFVLTLNDSPPLRIAPKAISVDFRNESDTRPTESIDRVSGADFPKRFSPPLLLLLRCPRKTVPKPKSGEISEGDKGGGGRGSLIDDPRDGWMDRVWRRQERWSSSYLPPLLLNFSP